MTKIHTLSLAVLLMAGAILSGCETVDGAGRDIENMGESVQESSQ